MFTMFKSNFYSISFLLLFSYLHCYIINYWLSSLMWSAYCWLIFPFLSFFSKIFFPTNFIFVPVCCFFLFGELYNKKIFRYYLHQSSWSRINTYRTPTWQNGIESNFDFFFVFPFYQWHDFMIWTKSQIIYFFYYFLRFIYNISLFAFEIKWVYCSIFYKNLIKSISIFTKINISE